MKKIIIVLLMILLVGCKSTINNNTDNPVENKQPEISREEVLKSWANKNFSSNDSTIDDDQVGRIYYSILRTIKLEISNDGIFEGCNEETSGVVYNIDKVENGVKKQYKIILDCDGITTTYYYDDVSEDSVPTYVKTEESKIN